MRRSFARRVGVLVTVTAALWTLSPDARGSFGGRSTSHAAPSPIAADALLENQWHLKDRSVEIGGANVRAAWPASLGAGVVIGIVDDGMQYAHPDLAPNYLASASYDFSFSDADPQPFTTSAHGTAVAGVAAARGDNSIGVSGVAPQASLAALRLTAVAATDAQEAAAFGFQPDVIDILNNSWNPLDNGLTLKAPGPLAAAARQSAATTGRNGKGRIFVWSSGNGRLAGDDCNFDGYANSRFAIAVGATTDAGNQVSTSEGCSALMVMAPSGGGTRALTTTDLMGSAGYDSSDYTSAFGASSTGAMSAAAPTVSGGVALMLARNPNLTWRDVQHILRRTSVRILPTDPGWTTGTFRHNERLGFGLLDAAAAVEMAGTWVNVPAEEVLAPATENVNLAIPDINATGINDTITISGAESNFVIEHIEVDFNATHTWRGDLQVKLTSPSGVVSILVPIRPSDGGDNLTNWKLGSVRHWGESPAGVWTLNVADRRFQDVGTWNNWTLRIYGYHTTASPPGGFGKSSPASGATGLPTNPTLSWAASTGAASYEYCIDTTNDNACSGWTNNGASTSVALSGLSAGLSYYWHVRAGNANGTTYAQGSSTAFWGFSTGAPPGAFAHSSPANGATGQVLTPTLTWTGSSGATSYEYCVDTSNNSACNATWVSTGSATSAALSGLGGGTPYYWHVRALNASGVPTYADGAATTFWSFTTVSAPGSFSHLSPANGAVGQSQAPILTWGTSANANNYEFCYDTTNDGACSTWLGAGLATSVGLSGLAAGTTYYWQVRATTAGLTTYAEGAPTTFWAFTTIGAPGAFTRTAPANGATGQPLNPTLSWGASASATSYEYCIDATNDSACANWTSTGAATSVGLSGLTAGTAYFWQVRATNTGGTTYGTGGATSFWSFTTLALPGAFAASTPANGATGQALNPTLSWGTSTNAASYEYCVDTTNDSACSGWVSTATNTSVGLSNLIAGTTYYWHARAINAVGTTYAGGSATTFTNFTTQVNAPAAFGHNSPGNGATGLTNSPTLSWSASAGAASFEYCIDTTNNNACDASWTSTGTNTSVALSNLAAGTAHFWQVRAINPGGTTYAEGAAASFWTFTTQVAAPAAFARTSPANGATGQLLSPTLSWGASTGATGYEYCIDTTNDSACANWISTGANTSVGLSGLTAGTAYFWQVRATNAGGTTYGTGGATSFWSLTTLALPGAFAASTPANGATGQSLTPTLSWGTSTNAASYEYCVDTTNDSACSGWASTGTSTSAVLSDLNAGTTYYWHARAINAVGTTYAGGSATTFTNFTTQVNAPAAFGHNSPGNGATGLTNSPTLSWSASAGAASFEYCIDTTNDNACSGWTSTGANTSVALSNLAAGTAHFWQVRAINPGGTTYAEGAATGYWTFTTQVAAPAAFTRTSPANGATGQLLSPTLSWGASTGATSYEYCIDTTNNSACNASWISTSTNTSVGLSGLTAGTAYYWHVRAINAGGTTYADGLATAFWNFTTQVAAPAAFSHTSPANSATGQSSSPTLSWGASAGAASFEYCIDTTNDSACSGWTSTGTNTNVGLSGLTAGTAYFWHVRAINPGGTTYAEGAATSFWTFTTQVGAPAAFSHTSPTSGATGQSSSPTLSWTASAGAASFEYCIDTTNDSACSGWTSTGANTSVGLSSLSANTTYYWQVRAINPGGTTYAEGAATTFWNFTTQVAAPAAFSHTSPANSATGQSSSPTLSWGASAGAASFEYCIDTTNDNACSGWTSTGANTSVALSNLAAGTAHFWQVRAINPGGTVYADGAATAFWSFTTQVAAPAAFGHTSPANSATGQSSSPTLSWNTSAGAASFEYCIDTTNDNACSGWTSTGANTSVALSNLAAGTAHFWHVRAINPGGTVYADGAATAFWSFTTQVAAPAAFGHTSPANSATGQSSSPTLSWNTSAGAASFEYCIDTTNDNACSGWTSTGANTSVALSNLAAGTAHFWQVRAINPGGTVYADGAATAFWSFTTQVAAPAAFGHTSPANGATGQSSSPTLSWGTSAGAASFEYCIDTTNDNACSGWTSTGANTSVALSNLAAGTAHFWQVRAINPGGTTYAEGAATTFWSFTTQVAAPAAFSHTSPANSATGQSSSPTLSWGASAGAASFEYCIDTTNDSACSGWTSTGTNTSVALSNLAAGTAHYWHVRAINAGGTTYADGLATAFWNFTTQVAAPAVFSHSSPANGAAGQSSSPTLSWTASSGATSYQYCIDTTNDNACSAWTSTGTNTSVALSNLTAGTAHYWHVRATNAGGTTYADGLATAFWNFTTQVAAPAAFSHSSPANSATGQSSSPTLSWTASAGAAGYEYCIDTTNNSACNASWISTSTNTSVGLSGLTAGTAYYWHVRAINAGGTTYADGLATAFWNFTTQVAAPAAFSHTSPANSATGQSSSPTLSWGASAGAASFEYCIDTTNDSACSGWTSTGTNTSVALSNLSAGTAHYWQVRAINAGGTTYANGAATAFWSFTTQVAAPAAFTKTSPANGATDQPTSLTLNWAASAGATGYEFCQDTTNDNACSGWTSTGTNTSTALSGLSQGTTYYWHVRASNAGGTTYANGAATTFWAMTTATAAPGAFARSGPANGAVKVSTNPTLSWTVSAGATSYEYCIDTVDNSACDTAWTTTGASHSVGLSGLIAGTTYYWHVRAMNAGGTTYANGTDTNFFNFTTKVPRRAMVDLNGDGSGDVFTYNPATGAWARQVSQAEGGFAQSVGTWAAGWTTLSATFNDDDMTDLFVFSADSGDWFKMMNTGSGFTVQSSSAWWPGWQKFVMDLDADGISDLFLYDPATGHWFKAISTLTGFNYYDGWWTPGWEITPMNLNGDDFGDLFLIDRTSGQWYWVLGEAGGGFTYPQAGYWAPDWAIYPGDFNADGHGDFFLYRPDAGEFYVALNNGSGYTYVAGYGWASGWTPTVADLNGDEVADLFLYNKATGKWFELQGDGLGQFATVGEGSWTAGWELHPTDFNDDGRADLLLYKPGTGEWFQAWNYNTGAFTYFGGQWQAGLNVVVRPPIR